MIEVAPQTRERAKPMRLLNAARTTYRLRGLDGAFIAVAVVAGLFLQLILFGGDKFDVALLFADGELLTLCALLVLAKWSRRALAIRALGPIACLYGAMLLCVAGEFLPFPIGIARDAYKAAGAGAAITIDKFSSLIELFKLAGLGAVFIIGVALGRDDDRARNAFRAFAALAAAYSVFAIGNFELFQNGPFLGSASGRWRLNATLLSPNTAATVLAMFAVLSWTAILRALQSNRSSQDLPLDRLRELLRLSLPWCPSLILSLWALTLTGSRGGGLAACIGLAVSSISMALGGLKSRRGLRLSLLIGGGSLVGMGLVGVFLLSQGSIGSRMTFAADGLADRGMILQIYLQHLAGLPWTGYGMGTFYHFNSLITAPGPTAGLWDLGAMHDVYLQWIYEAGWIAAALMFSSIAWILFVIVGGLKRRHFGRTWIVGALGVSGVVLSHGIVDYALQIPAIAGLWSLILGLGVGVSRPPS